MAYRYEFARTEDGEEISRLLEHFEFKGMISLAYCRRPNAVLSLAREGEKTAWVITRDKEGKIVAAGGCVINGETAYLTGLRAIKRVNLTKGYELLREFCTDNGVKLTYTTILNDNKNVRAMLEKQRPNMPHYLKYGECVVNIIQKKLRVKDNNVLSRDGDFYVLKNPSGAELARGKAIEQWDYKQYIVKGYSPVLRLIKPFVKWMPDKNDVLKFFILGNVFAADNKSLESFLRHMSNLPAEGGFFLFGGAYCPVKSIKYKSIIYIVDWDKTLTDPSAIDLDIEISEL